MAKPAQMFDHELNGLKGFYPGQPWVVDRANNIAAADVAVAATLAKYLPGKVVHLDSNGEFKLGPGTQNVLVGGGSCPMCFILFQGSSDFDVVGDDFNFVGATSTYNSTVPSASRADTVPRVMGVAVTTAAEVQSTEYATGTYVPGECLTANSDGELAHTIATAENTVIGIVSGAEGSTSGLVQSEHGDKAGSSVLNFLQFHTCFFPITTTS